MGTKQTPTTCDLGKRKRGVGVGQQREEKPETKEGGVEMKPATWKVHRSKTKKRNSHKKSLEKRERKEQKPRQKNAGGQVKQIPQNRVKETCCTKKKRNAQDPVRYYKRREKKKPASSGEKETNKGT